MLTVFVTRIIILIIGILHPAYRSYKALRSRDPKAHVKWMMYWIVFALYTAVETITDIILCWFPFYYEIKLLFLAWLISPVTNGSSILYRKLIHPNLEKKEKAIDEAINKASQRGYTTLLSFGARGLNYAASTVITTAMKSYENLHTLVPAIEEGQGMLVDRVRRSYSMGDVSLAGLSAKSTRPPASHITDISDDEDDADPSLGIFSANSSEFKNPTVVSGRGDNRKKERPAQRKNDPERLPSLDEEIKKNNDAAEKVIIVRRGQIAQSARRNRSNTRRTTPVVT